MTPFRAVLAEISPSLAGASGMPEVPPWLAVVFLGLLIAGLLADLYLFLGLLLRPVRWAVREERVLRRPWNISATARLALGLLAWYLVASVGASVWAAREDHRTLALALQGMAFNLVGFGAVALTLRRRGLSWGGAFGFRLRTAWRDTGAGLVFYLSALPILWFYALVYQTLLKASGYQAPWQEVVMAFASESSPWIRLLVVVLAVGVAPIFEEILFRGIALPLLARRWGVAPAVVAVSAFFAVIHLHVPSLVPLFIIAVSFSLGYLYTGSLLAPVVMHALFNGVNLWILAGLK